MPSEEFSVIGPKNGSNKVARSVLPTRAALPVPRLEVRLARPLAPSLQVGNQRSGLFVLGRLASPAA